MTWCPFCCASFTDTTAADTLTPSPLGSFEGAFDFGPSVPPAAEVPLRQPCSMSQRLLKLIVAVSDCDARVGECLERCDALLAAVPSQPSTLPSAEHYGTELVRLTADIAASHSVFLRSSTDAANRAGALLADLKDATEARHAECRRALEGIDDAQALMASWFAQLRATVLDFPLSTRKDGVVTQLEKVRARPRELGLEFKSSILVEAVKATKGIDAALQRIETSTDAIRVQFNATLHRDPYDLRLHGWQREITTRETEYAECVELRRHLVANCAALRAAIDASALDIWGPATEPRAAADRTNSSKRGRQEALSAEVDSAVTRFIAVAQSTKLSSAASNRFMEAETDADGDVVLLQPKPCIDVSALALGLQAKTSWISLSPSQ